MAVIKRSPKADTDSGESYVGQRIAKDFDGDIFYGTVSKYFPKDRLWKIDYDDGDKEELELEELLFALDLHMEKTKKKRKRTKKGGGTSSGVDDVSIAAVKRQVSLEKPLTTKSQSPDATAKYRISGNVDTKDFPGRVFGMTNRPIKVDILKFARNRCRVQGGHTEHPSKFPGSYESKTSFAYLMQRLSDRNYCMRALCIDGSGAEYTTYKGSANVSTAPVTWFPATSLNDHSDDETVVDACHLDLSESSESRFGFADYTSLNLSHLLLPQSTPRMDSVYSPAKTFVRRSKCREILSSASSSMVQCQMSRARRYRPRTSRAQLQCARPVPSASA